MHVNRSINALEPVNVKVEIGKAVVTFDNSVLQESEIINAIETEGYKVINLKEV
jgi:copper chaperone CopZ